MKLSLRHIVDHLVWSASGTVWAVWSLTPAGSRYMPDRTREQITAHVTSLVRSLPGRARLFGLCARIDAGEVVQATLDGVDYRRHGAWAEVAEAQLRLLAGEDLDEPVDMYRRTLWLAVPLPAVGGRGQWQATAGTAWSELAGLLGLPPAPVGTGEVAEYRERAGQVEAELGGGVGLRRATPAEIVWMHQHAVGRGLDGELLGEAERSPLRGSRMTGGRLRSPSHADLGQVRLLEGGRPETAAGPSSARRPARTGQGRGSGGVWGSVAGRRWLQVDSEAGTSYQAHLALAEMPARFTAVGGEFFAELDRMPFAVDWTVDLTTIASEKVVEAVTKKKRDLVDQADQYAARRATGLPDALHDAADDLGDLSARASRSSVEVEVQSVTALTVWGATPAECDQRAAAVQARLKGANYRLVRPVGGQEELFTLGLPATVTPPAVRQYVQHELGEDWAMHGALHGQSFGDPTGAMVGYSQDLGTISPVLLNIADAPARNASASFALAGDLGGGKSTLLKLITSSVVDRGGRAIAIDRTKSREWARFARSAAPGRCQVVDAATADMSIDPLRVFADPEAGARYALSYLTVQLGVGAMTEHGALLKTAVKRAAAAPGRSMALVLDALEDMAREDSARGQRAAALVEWLRVAADEPLAAAVFDPALPPLDLAGDLTSDFVVITTTGLTLPPREAATNPELLRAQPLEALIGRAVLYLIAAIARETAFTDPRFTLLPLDEAYWLTSSAEGQALIDEIVYDGRKHGAGVGLGCHDVLELGTSTTQGLLAYRFLARTADPVLAARGLTWLGLPGDDEELLRMVTTDLSPYGRPERAGEFLARDPRMNTGRFKVLVPGLTRITDGIYTTPTGPDTQTAPAPSRYEPAAPALTAPATTGGTR
ncbi:ATP-binding protein [Streptomyces filamentosus]|uniref:ATP/GTP-binding protein n=1 Tax=Streptomyces filamentosus TaxID=67294 RepID=A0A919BQ74_STRFL|nr:ATP-binding protein [Streptomyces filamentosus]GHG04287.1 ATP/GTP-binding protein [Streptomyces filamentosus]